MTGPQPPRPPHPPQPRQPGHPGDPSGQDPGLALAGLDPAAWTRASTVQVLPIDYARRSADGRWLGVYTPVPIAHPPQWCDHLDSVCRSCLPAWAEDHALALFRHGPAGARAGCACPVCRSSRPRLERTATGDDPAASRPGTLHACLPDVGGTTGTSPSPPSPHGPPHGQSTPARGWRAAARGHHHPGPARLSGQPAAGTRRRPR
jgi:hypothetical protein